MRKLVIYGGAFLLTVACAALVVVLLASTFLGQWARRDVELRSRLIFNSIHDSLNLALQSGAPGNVVGLFERVSQDDRMLAIGYCDASGSMRYLSKTMPKDFSCAEAERAQRQGPFTEDIDGRHIHVAVFPVTGAGGATGNLVLLHDLTYAQKRVARAETYLAIILGIIILVSGALATAVIVLSIGGWVRGLRQSIVNVQSGHDVERTMKTLGPLGEELRDVLRQMALSGNAIDGERVSWTTDTLRQVMTENLPGAEVLVVSNREPYIHNHAEDGVDLQIPASGLVSALEPVMRACGGTWIAHGSGDADRETVDKDDRLLVPPSDPSYTLRRVWLTDEEQDGYYYGLANEGLWPLCHIAFVQPNFRESDWQAYKTVNERFADAVAREAESDAPIVLIQDYHFGLLPRMVRERLPNATIITFWHIPWPNSETFGIFPWKEEIIDGLLGSSILGFHTQFHCNNFLETVDRFVESRIDREAASVTLRGEETFIRPYPISIEWPPAALARQAPVPDCRANVRRRLRLAPDVKLAVGIERFDYTKGIVDRMQAIDSFLANHPEWLGRFVFVQAAAPSRSKLPAYRHLQEEAERLTREVNAKYGTPDWQPIRLVVRHHGPDEVFELFRAADICLVSSLHDGMNLVAKEFIAARDDEEGVLILSNFAGAARELSEAIIGNPYDPHAMGEAIQRALDMPVAEQRERMRLMREQVSSRNVYRWAGRMLVNASQLRKRQHLLSLTESSEPGGYSI